jgi:hypothetical protein
MQQAADPGAREAREIDEVIGRLQDRFPDHGQEQIRAAVTNAHREFEGRPIRDFVPIFVERAARATLTTPTG